MTTLHRLNLRRFDEAGTVHIEHAIIDQDTYREERAIYVVEFCYTDTYEPDENWRVICVADQEDPELYMHIHRPRIDETKTSGYAVDDDTFSNMWAAMGQMITDAYTKHFHSYF